VAARDDGHWQRVVADSLDVTAAEPSDGPVETAHHRGVDLAPPRVS
jgi:hypothetical protein